MDKGLCLEVPFRPELKIEELYCTVRAGKTCVFYYLEGGRKVLLLHPEGAPFANAEIDSCWYLPFADIPAPWLLIGVEGKSLSEVYAAHERDGIDPSSDVSIVFFVVTEFI